jgi:hypothetical protein
MGTRNLFKIIKDNKTVLAKYNQWDGYLDGQGKELSDFIIDDLNFEALNNGLTRVRFLDENSSELNDIRENKDVNQYPLLTRNTTIREQLRAISLGALSLETFDSSEFQNDGCFCEYTYVLNLDTNTITVYDNATPKEIKKGTNWACENELFTCDILEYPSVLDKHIELNKGE